jgi:hypothetical protein
MSLDAEGAAEQDDERDDDLSSELWGSLATRLRMYSSISRHWARWFRTSFSQFV